MLEEDNDTSENFRPYKDKKSILEEQNIEKDHKDLKGKILNTKNHVRNVLLRRTLHNKLFASELSSFLKEVKFSEQKFPISKPVSNIKYHHPSS